MKRRGWGEGEGGGGEGKKGGGRRRGGEGIEGRKEVGREYYWGKEGKERKRKIGER